MNPARLGLLAFAVTGMATSSLAVAWAPTPPAERSLAAGHPWAEVLPDTGGAGLIHAVIDIAASPKTVWAVMTDCRMAARLVTSITSCKITQGGWRQGWDVRETMTKGNLIVPAIHNIVRDDFQPYSLVRFHKIGGDLAIEEGEWRLEARSGSVTRLIYVNRVAANINAPAVLVRAGMRGDVSKVLMNIRRESESVSLK